MRLYFHEDGKVRPCILIAPGGGYSVVSPSEGEIVAKKFYEMGYHTAVVTYTTNLLQMIPLKLQPMQDLMRAIRYIRKHAEELHVDKDKIMLCGFSAGAHACGSVAVHWQEFENTETGEYASISAKPNAVILSYGSGSELILICTGFTGEEDSVCIPCIFQRETRIVTC